MAVYSMINVDVYFTLSAYNKFIKDARTTLLNFFIDVGEIFTNSKADHFHHHGINSLKVVFTL